MNKLIRLYNQNRELVIIIIIIIALAFITIQTLNSLVKKDNEAKKNNILNGVNSSIEENSTAISPSNTSAITGETVRDSKNNEDIIKQFIKYCNEGKFDLAYSMLTDDCKSLYYPSLERFKNDYINRIFSINRMYTLENWYVNGNFTTYHIKYIEDILSSGNTSSSNNISDYITVIRG